MNMFEAKDAAGEPIFQWADDMEKAVELANQTDICVLRKHPWISNIYIYIYMYIYVYVSFSAGDAPRKQDGCRVKDTCSRE